MALSDLRKYTRQALRPGVVAFGLVVLSLVIVRTYGVQHVLFPTWALPKNPPRPPIDRGEVWTLETDQGTVEAFFFPAGPRAPTVIFTHGNAELIEQHLPLVQQYRTHGFSVLLPEYRGYGRSHGTPSASAVVDDFIAFYERLRNQPNVDPSRIYFHGRSLGGAIAAAASAKRAPRALILESTFASVLSLARERHVPSILVADSFDSERVLTNVSFPALLLHGTNDDIVPARHASRLAAVIPKHKVVLMPCGHNDCPFAEAQILEFLNSEK